MLFVSPGVYPYVPEAAREKSEIVFGLAVFEAREFAAVQDAALDELGFGMRRGTYVYELLRRGIRTLEGPGVPEITFDEKTGHATDEFLGRLSGELKTELAGVLDEWNTVGPAKGKASES